MKLLIALAAFVVLAYAADELSPAVNDGDLAVDEHKWRGYGGYYAARPYYSYGHYGGSRYGGYYGHHRGRRSAAVEIPAAMEADQSAQEHHYGGYRGYGGYYGSYYRPYGGYGGHYYGRPYWG